jgi:hypothetical protein
VLWWGCVIHFLYWQEYDNNPAGAWASMGIAAMTLLIVLIYLIGFSIAAIRDAKNRSRYLLTIILLLLPIIGIALFEYLK